MLKGSRREVDCASLKERIAKAIFQNRGMWNEERADEFFAAYGHNPKQLEPEFAQEVRDAYADAESCMDIFMEMVANLERRITALEGATKS